QVESGNATGNFGTTSNMFIQSASSGFGNERGWLKFDLTLLPPGSVITAASLEMYCWKTTGASLPVEVRSSTDGWTETGINFSNQPALGSVLASSSLLRDKANFWYTWDVTSFVAAEFAGDKTVSLVLKPVTESSGPTGPSYGFDAREFGSAAPIL